MRCDLKRYGLAIVPAVTAAPALAVPPELPSQFAGEALTVALAFAFPALAAGAYLAIQSMRSRFGRRRLVIVSVLAFALGVAAVGFDDKAGWLLQAGLAAS